MRAHGAEKTTGQTQSDSWEACGVLGTYVHRVRSERLLDAPGLRWGAQCAGRQMRESERVARWAPGTATEQREAQQGAGPGRRCRSGRP